MQEGIQFNLLKMLLLSIALCLGIQSSLAIELKHLSVYRDKSKTPEERINILQGLLHDEINSPTERHQGFGGDIYHEYVMAQIIRAIYHVGRQLDDLNYLKDLVRSESGPAKEALQIALGNCGDTSVEDDLIKFSKGDGDYHLRELAIEGLLEVHAISALPDLIELLKDGTEATQKNYSTGNLEKDFPVRRVAAFSLDKFGVEVKQGKGFGYQVDRGKAVSVLEKELKTVSNETALKVLKAISRVGGEQARKSLKNFIEGNESQDKNKELVSEAKKLLVEMDTDQATESKGKK